MTGESRETLTWISDLLLKAAAGVCVALLWFAQNYLADMSRNIEDLKSSVQQLAIETKLVERELKAINAEIDALKERVFQIETSRQK